MEKASTRRTRPRIGYAAAATVALFAGGEAGRLMGITPVQHQAYKEAWLQILEDGVPGNSAPLRKSIESMDKFGKLAPLTVDQEREAQALTKQVIDAWRRSRKS